MIDSSTKEVLTFRLNDDGKLLAVFEKTDYKPPLDMALIKEALTKQGMANLFLYENALTHLLKQYNTPNEGFTLEIGERRNGECAIQIDIVKMSARLTLIPPYGGTSVTFDQIQMALKEKGIVRGIMINEIQAALKEGYAAERIIARGLEPVKGNDARFQSLIPQIRERKPQVDKQGIADYRDLGDLIVVKKGDPLMFRTPPTAGKNGWDITGQVLLPQRGKDTQFASGLQGVELEQEVESDPDNNSLLLAAITGQPKLVPNGVIVEPTVNLSLVDISTGNVNFDGTINIKGDVKDGMKVYASGDVFIGGTVEAAEIVADGNIVIKGGVIGHHSGDVNEAPVYNAKILSKGSISARFAENVAMDADIDIIIGEFSMHNHLSALNRILVGKSGGKKGRIIGGISSASNLVKTGVLGTNAGFITKVCVGFNPHLQSQLDRLKLKIDVVEKELEDIKKIIAFILSHPEKDKDGLLNKLLHTREQLEADCPRLHSEHMNILSQMTLPEQVQVIVEEAVHCGVEIQLGHAIFKNNQERGKGVFQIIEGAIKFGKVF